MENEDIKYVQIVLSGDTHQALKMAALLDASKRGCDISIKEACKDAVNSYICYHFDTDTVDKAITKLEKLRTELAH